jgi:hypothetical protein
MTKASQTDLRLAGLGGRAGAARAISLLFLLRRWRVRNARGIGAVWREATSASPNNHPLASLAGGDLEGRFHAWHGRSGRRYICSVFPVDLQAADAGLPEFAEAIVIAVGEYGGARRVVAFLQCADGASAGARQAFVAAALKAGARQWHVHLLLAAPRKRRAAIADIEALCHSPAPTLAAV